MSFVDRVLPWRRPIIVLAHAVLVTLAYWLAFVLSFDFRLSPDEWAAWSRTLPLVLVARLVVFQWFHLYGGLWRYVSMRDIVVILKAGTVSSLMLSAGILAAYGRAFPVVVLILDWLLCLALVGGVRLTLRVFRESLQRGRNGDGRRAIIVGAGDAGEILLRELGRTSALEYEIMGFVDDDPAKQHMRIHDVEVIGTIDQLDTLTRSLHAQEILIAIPSGTREQKQRIVQRCRESGVTFKTVPGLSELFAGRARIGQLQEVRPEDMLGRVAVRLDVDGLRQELHGKRILVTGAAGSIGSELCRQLVGFEPEMLIMLDRAESGLYFTELELKRASRSVKIVPVVGDIGDRRKMEETIEVHAPDILFHAAAYKHVPLMEAHPLEAIQNNIFGTETVALSARKGGLKKVVLISTDKAVRPVGIMGMTKRVAENLIGGLNGGATKFVAVRFGNVLGSDGSVLPLFQWQIAHGGPVTVTDPEASRYFMLLSEAAQLVLQAGAMGKGGEGFFLDMGEPVRILDLAHNLVRLSGFEPGTDIAIEMTGLRPGERLTEELVMEGEALSPTAHEKVFTVRPGSFSGPAFQEDLEALRRLVTERDQKGAVARLKAMAESY